MFVHRPAFVPYLGCPSPVVVFRSPPPDKSPSLVDFSFYHPGSSASTNSGAVSPAGYYFPDGKDDGSEFPVALRKGVDLAEVSQAFKELDKQAMNHVRSQVSELQRQKEFQEFNEYLNTKVKSSVGKPDVKE